MDKLIELFCVVDHFCKDYLPKFEQSLLNASGKVRKRKGKLSMSEVMTIVIHFHQSHYRSFKHYYLWILSKSLKPYFPQLVSYSRMVELIQSALIPLTDFVMYLLGQKRGLYFIESTPIEVCHIKRANRNKVFKGIAEKSKSTMGWFFGFKLHLIVNDKGELLSFKMTSSKTDDRKPVLDLARGLTGKMVGDKGYISQPLSDMLRKQGLQLITRTRKNMKAKLLSMFDKVLLRKRAIVESVIDQLKNISQIEHSRHRSVNNFLVNVVAGLAAYCLKPKKPSLNINENQLALV